jgi:hypothetical protein
MYIPFHFCLLFYSSIATSLGSPTVRTPPPPRDPFHPSASFLRRARLKAASSGELEKLQPSATHRRCGKPSRPAAAPPHIDAHLQRPMTSSSIGLRRAAPAACDELPAPVACDELPAPLAAWDERAKGRARESRRLVREPWRPARASALAPARLL